MPSPGDVYRFYSGEADKKKYHVCVSLNGTFLFLNSPKKKRYPTDFEFPCSEMEFVPATDTGVSIISCSLPMKFTDHQLKLLKAKRVGVLPRDLFLRLIKYVEENPVLSDDEKSVILDGLAEWF